MYSASSRGHLRVVFAVAHDEVVDVVAHHAAEPAQLVPLMCQVVADVGRSDHADRDRVRVAALVLGSVAYRLQRPFKNLRIGELEHEPVGVTADHVERLRAVGRDPDR